MFNNVCYLCMHTTIQVKFQLSKRWPRPALLSDRVENRKQRGKRKPSPVPPPRLDPRSPTLARGRLQVTKACHLPASFFRLVSGLFGCLKPALAEAIRLRGVGGMPVHITLPVWLLANITKQSFLQQLRRNLLHNLKLWYSVVLHACTA